MKQKNINGKTYFYDPKKDIIFQNFTQIKDSEFYIRTFSDEPRDLCIEITTACNMTCKNCFSNSIAFLDGKFIDYEFIYKIMMQYRQDVIRILITGGEPMLHPDIKEILKLSHVFNDINFVMNTNGSISFKPFIEFAKNWTFAISLHGKKNTHNEYTKSSEFKNIVQNIKFLHMHNCRIHLYTVIHKSLTVKDIEWLINFRDELDIEFLRFIIPREYGRYEKVVNNEIVNFVQSKKDERMGLKIDSSNTLFIGTDKIIRKTH